LALGADSAFAQQLSLDLGESGSLTGRVVQLVALLTVLSLAPSILVMVTSFTRIVVVLSLVRSAMGVQQTPPNSVIVSLALFLTAFVMAPTFERAYDEGIEPLINEEIEETAAFSAIIAPFHVFMLKHARERDIVMFTDLTDEPAPDNPEDLSLRILIPAFMVGELKRAFEIGFLIFVPFVIIDMVVASVLMSMGMMMLPPIIIALPFKLIFFVMVDGWSLIAGSLVQSFGP
jgi:flagellar biosynthetic protein FliP